MYRGSIKSQFNTYKFNLCIPISLGVQIQTYVKKIKFWKTKKKKCNLYKIELHILKREIFAQKTENDFFFFFKFLKVLNSFENDFRKVKGTMWFDKSKTLDTKWGFFISNLKGFWKQEKYRLGHLSLTIYEPHSWGRKFILTKKKKILAQGSQLKQLFYSNYLIFKTNK